MAHTSSCKLTYQKGSKKYDLYTRKITGNFINLQSLNDKGGTYSFEQNLSNHPKIYYNSIPYVITNVKAANNKIYNKGGSSFKITEIDLSGELAKVAIDNGSIIGMGCVRFVNEDDIKVIDIVYGSTRYVGIQEINLSRFRESGVQKITTR